MLRFDFAICDSENRILCLIEYQGEQHFRSFGKAPFFGKLQREETDLIKKNYCKQNAIPLHEVRYDDDVELRIFEILHTLQDNTVLSA